jgi:hypothetical protein
MILSHKYRFIYIKTYKTASTSIETALSEICGPDDIITPASEQLMKHRTGNRAQNFRLDHPLVPKRPLIKRLLRRPERYYHPSIGYYEHMPAWRVKAYVGDEIWSDYYKFSFERNPWDRQVSWYYYKTKSKSSRPSFNQFNEEKRKAYVDNFNLYAIDDIPCLDFVGSYETLNSDFKKVLKHIGLDGINELPHVNESDGRDTSSYRDYFDDVSRDLMQQWYAREITAFGYEF